MTDRIFFLCAFLAAAVMVAIAVLPGFNTRPTGPVSGGNTDYRRIEVSGAQLNRFVAGGDADISLVRADGEAALRIEVAAATLADDPIRGPHFILDRDLETVFAGREVRITIRARAADQYGAEQMRVNYSVGSAIESGWEKFTITREFADSVFTWTPPERTPGTDAGYDYLGIRPVVPEKQRAILVQSVVFEPAL
ncbi:hypothetical protein [Henriciella marina]|uniref:hypothetical protein n=1 Tax=Henriciella marina TaxID=453851 RepID=UPI00038153A5|nr:hypothetical protein [Henriciella marina]